MKSNRRAFLASAGATALGITNLRDVAVAAQSAPTSPHMLGDGSLLTWTDPWTSRAFLPYEPLAEIAVLSSGQVTLGVGYFSVRTPITDWVTAHLASSGLGTEVAPAVAGGSYAIVGAGSSAESQLDYRVHLYKDVDGTLFGIYYQTSDQMNATLLFAPVSTFATTVASVQATASLDDTPVLANVDGAAVQADLEAGAGRLDGSDSPEEAAVTPGDGSEYTDSTGNMLVTWPEGWTVVSQHETGMELANPEQTAILTLQVVPVDGRSWEQIAKDDSAWLVGDQGSNATLTSPIVTATGYSFATNGDYGLRLVQGSATENDLDHYVRVFASNMEANGAAALAILGEIQAAITVNGQPPLKDLDLFIDMSES